MREHGKENLPNFCEEIIKFLRSSELCDGVEELLLAAEGEGLEVRLRI